MVESYKKRVMAVLDGIIIECVCMVREQLDALKEGKGSEVMLHLAYGNLNTAVYIRNHLPD